MSASWWRRIGKLWRLVTRTGMRSCAIEKPTIGTARVPARSTWAAPEPEADCASECDYYIS
jgi:hypothetical protein